MSIEMYWDKIQSWDGEKGEIDYEIVGFSTGTPSLTFTPTSDLTSGDTLYLYGGKLDPYVLKITIPETDPKTHYLWLTDPFNEEKENVAIPIS